uniref:Phosphatidylinositol-glycan biosynthesis class X protein n=1 Tax=Clastoptera arizonana TaxID=38151 RepID=A0A1B6CAH1_9HEMI
MLEWSVPVGPVVRSVIRDSLHSLFRIFRNIHSLVEIVTSNPILHKQYCSFVLQEILPEGAFVNTDQLDDLNRFGVVSACANTSVDVEAPQHLSEPISVLIYSNITRKENLLSADLKLPIHARYHSPQPEGGHRTITISPPKVMIKCAKELNCKNLKKVNLPCDQCDETLCSWTQLPFKTNAEILKMLVPVGNTQHYTLVTSVTLLITYCGCIYILSVILSPSINI